MPYQVDVQGWDEERGGRRRHEVEEAAGPGIFEFQVQRNIKQNKNLRMISRNSVLERNFIVSTVEKPGLCPLKVVHFSHE
jgi:hypothetical protein